MFPTLRRVALHLPRAPRRRRYAAGHRRDDSTRTTAVADVRVSPLDGCPGGAAAARRPTPPWASHEAAPGPGEPPPVPAPTPPPKRGKTPPSIPERASLSILSSVVGLELRRSDLSAALMSIFCQTGINLLAVDFDLTLIDVHTGGCWVGSAAALASRVRPCMKRILDEALNSGIHVAVVTFSPQAG